MSISGDVPEDLVVAVLQANAPALRGLPPPLPAVRAAARLMSLLEDRPALFPQLVATGHRVAARLGFSIPEPKLVLGLTGAPGAGKSTLSDALVRTLRERETTQRVGVIAVDPSSPFSGGALLGDRVRMMRHAVDPMVFVRSLASRGHLGGLALGVKGALHVMAMLGIDVILLETVGVGQSEVEVVRVADEVAVVLAPGQGDSVQLLKAGLMEIGDFIVINKADRDGAAELHHQVLAALKLEEASDRHVSLVAAVEQRGVSDFWCAVEERAASRREVYATRRAAALSVDVREALLEGARERLLAALETGAFAQEALHGETPVAELVQALLEKASNIKEYSL